MYKDRKTCPLLPKICCLTHTFNSTDVFEHTHPYRPVSFETRPSMYKLIELYITFMPFLVFKSLLSPLLFLASLISTFVLCPIMTSVLWPPEFHQPIHPTPNLIYLLTVYHVFTRIPGGLGHLLYWFSNIVTSWTLQHYKHYKTQTTGDWLWKRQPCGLCLVNMGPHLAGHRLLHKYVHLCRRLAPVLFHGGGPHRGKNSKT